MTEDEIEVTEIDLNQIQKVVDSLIDLGVKFGYENNPDEWVPILNFSMVILNRAHEKLDSILSNPLGCGDPNCKNCGPKSQGDEH